MSKVTLTDNIQKALVKIVEGNPGALTVCMSMLKHGDEIGPECGASLIPILCLDDMGIYGSRIWMLYKDVYQMNLAHTLGLLRARQLGIISETTLSYAIDNMSQGLHLDTALEQVSEKLPKFNMAWVASSP